MVGADGVRVGGGAVVGAGGVVVEEAQPVFSVVGGVVLEQVRRNDA